MNLNEIQQLIHGYNHGHEQLAGSVNLPPKESETVTRLSDLSGQLCQGTEIVPYLTGYPLKGKSLYALAKTWADNQASRAGCVLTHTLLIPSTVWSSDSPERFFELFRYPKREVLGEFCSSLELTERSSCTLAHNRSLVKGTEREFVEKYFGEGIRPIVWLDVDTPIDCIRQILRGIWPALRSDISFCTYTLQPRYLGDNPFHIMFAPSSAYSRFQKVPRENIIGYAARATADHSHESEEPWCSKWSDALFLDADEPASKIREYTWLSQLLGSDPIEIRNLYLLEELRLRLNENPNAIIGFLDLVEKLAPRADQAINYKDQAIIKALDSFINSPGKAGTLNALASLGVRLMTSPYASLSTGIESLFMKTVTEATQRYPEQSLLAIRETGQAISNSKSLFVKAASIGLEELSDDAVPNFEQFPDLAPYLIGENPNLAVKYLQPVLNDRISHWNRIQSLTKWLERITSEGQRQQLRVCLLPVLNVSSTDALLDQLLQGISEENIPGCLDVLSHTFSGGLMPHFEIAIGSSISKCFPHQVRIWASHSSAWHPWCAYMVARSYPRDQIGLQELLCDQSIEGAKSTDVLAAFLLLFAGQLPPWVKEFMLDDAVILTRLLKAADSFPDLIADALKIVVYQITETPLTDSQDLAPFISRVEVPELRQQVVNLAMGSVIRTYLSGRTDDSTCLQWQNSEWGKCWLESATLGDLWIPLGLDNRSRADRVSAWMWIAQAPDNLYFRNDQIIIDLVSRLKSIHSVDVQHQTVLWCKVINRASKTAPKDVYLRLCADALYYSFWNVKLPVSELVIASFLPLYNALTLTEDFPNSIEKIFGFYGWDKGKELRKLLIKAFMESAWPPGDLALAVREPMLLQRIIRRASRLHRGEQYIESVANDLAKRSEAEAIKLSIAVRDGLRARHNWNSWD